MRAGGVVRTVLVAIRAGGELLLLRVGAVVRVGAGGAEATREDDELLEPEILGRLTSLPLEVRLPFFTQSLR